MSDKKEDLKMDKETVWTTYCYNVTCKDSTDQFSLFSAGYDARNTEVERLQAESDYDHKEYKRLRDNLKAEIKKRDEMIRGAMDLLIMADYMGDPQIKGWISRSKLLLGGE